MGNIPTRVTHGKEAHLHPGSCRARRADALGKLDSNESQGYLTDPNNGLLRGSAIYLSIKLLVGFLLPPGICALGQWRWAACFSLEGCMVCSSLCCLSLRFASACDIKRNAQTLLVLPLATHNFTLAKHCFVWAWATRTLVNCTTSPFSAPCFFFLAHARECGTPPTQQWFHMPVLNLLGLSIYPCPVFLMVRAPACISRSNCHPSPGCNGTTSTC